MSHGFCHFPPLSPPTHPPSIILQYVSYSNKMLDIQLNHHHKCIPIGFWQAYCASLHSAFQKAARQAFSHGIQTVYSCMASSSLSSPLLGSSFTLTRIRYKLFYWRSSSSLMSRSLILSVPSRVLLNLQCLRTFDLPLSSPSPFLYICPRPANLWACPASWHFWFKLPLHFLWDIFWVGSFSLFFCARLIPSHVRLWLNLL